MHPIIDPVHIIETRKAGLEVAVIELVQVTAMLTGLPASALAAITARLEERIATHRNEAQLRRIIRSQITACRRSLQSVGWSLEAQDTRIILTDHRRDTQP